MDKKDNYNKLSDQIEIIADKPGSVIPDTLRKKDLGVCDKDPQIIDVFSSSGLVKIKNTEYIVLGSSLLAAKSVINSGKSPHKKYAFDKIFPNELPKVPSHTKLMAYY